MPSSRRTRVYCAGVFDVFHIGHLNILKRAANLGDELHVGVLTDDGAEAYKRRPFVPFAERLAIVESLSCVTAAFQQLDTDPTKYGELQLIDPDILVHGSDWDRVGGQKWMEKRGRKVVFLPYTPGVSTSQRIQELKRWTCPA